MCTLYSVWCLVCIVCQSVHLCAPMCSVWCMCSVHCVCSVCYVLCSMCYIYTTHQCAVHNAQCTVYCVYRVWCLVCMCNMRCYLVVNLIYCWPPFPRLATTNAILQVIALHAHQQWHHTKCLHFEVWLNGRSNHILWTSALAPHCKGVACQRKAYFKAWIIKSFLHFKKTWFHLIKCWPIRMAPDCTSNQRQRGN